MSEHKSTSVAIIDLLRDRKSHRALSPAPIDRPVIFRMLEAARWAPSARNEQPWRFVIVDRKQEAQFSDLVGTLLGSNALWASNASLFIVVVVKNTWGSEGKANPYAYYDAGQAVAHLTVQAQVEGISIRQMGAFDKAKAANCIGVADGFETFLILAVGKPGNVDDLPDDLRTLELARRTRKGIDEIAFSTKWEEALS